MKTRRILCLALAVACISAVSCKKETPYTEATVTVKTADSGECILQLDDNTVLKPQNLSNNPFGREVRAFIIYKNGKTLKSSDSDYEYRSCTLGSIDSIRTKAPVAPGKAKSDAGIEILRNWANSIEDGYLTLAFEAMWGLGPRVHYLNLETTDDPLVFVLKHDCNEDTDPVRFGSGLIAFDLHSLPFPKSGNYDVTIKYQGYTKEKAIVFHCVDGVFSRPESAALADASAGSDRMEAPVR